MATVHRYKLCACFPIDPKVELSKGTLNTSQTVMKREVFTVVNIQP